MPEEITAEITVRTLRVDEWELIRETYILEFGNDMPINPAVHRFLGVFQGEKLLGFAHLETVLHLNCVYLEKDARQKDVYGAIFNDINASVPRGEDLSLILFSEKPLTRLKRSYGMDDKGQGYIGRKDF